VQDPNHLQKNKGQKPFFLIILCVIIEVVMNYMKPYFQLGLMPLIGAFIGWGTNLLAIRLIFWPLEPIRIPILGIEVQGLIPKRRFDISRSIGEVLEHEIISPEEIIDSMTSEKAKGEIIAFIRNVVAKKISEKLPGFIPSGLRNSIADYVGDLIDKNGTELVDEMKGTITEKAKERLDLKKLVEDKINSLDLLELEDLIIRLSKQELKQIEILGGVLGFFVGVVQAAISYLLM